MSQDTATPATPEISPEAASPEADRLAFFRVSDEGDAAPAPDAGALAPDPAPATAADPASSADDAALPEFVDPAAPAEETVEDGFTPPAWIASLPPESRAEAERFARGQYEQTQKHKKRSSEAVTERAQAAQQLEEIKQKLEALEASPPAVVVPEIALPDLRTKAEVDAFVENAPAKLQEIQQWHANCVKAIKAIQDDGEVEMLGRKWTESDLPTIQQEMAQSANQFHQVQKQVAQAPKRYAYLEKFEAATAEAKKHYPALFKADSAMAKAKETLLKEAPSLAAAPRHPVIVGDHLTMEMVRAGKYRLVPVDPKAAKSPSAAKAAVDDTSAAPLPRTADAAAERDLSAIKTKADQGDRAAQEQLRNAFFKVA
jgi:hypothetical protein